MRPNRHCAVKQPGFTVLELLVVTAIIGILLGLLLPALMSARESARCMQCKSNLHEIGLAIQQHHDAAKRLPEAWTIASDKVSGYGWAVVLLPYLEESSVGRSINCKLPVADVQNDMPRNSDLPIMRCPSDISEPTFELLAEQPGAHDHHGATSALTSTGVAETSLVRLPAANYLGVYGTLEADETFPAPAGDGPIVSNRKVRYSDLQHGQSHTLIVGERTTAMAPSTWYGV